MSYTEITQTQFEYVLSHLGKIGYTWKKLDEIGAKETIYMVSINNINIKIFSSLVNGLSRDVGTDAIRVVGWDIENDKAILSLKRVNRTYNWCENLKERINETVDKIISIKKCKVCGGYIVKMKGKYGEFDGCLSYKKHKLNNKRKYSENDKEFWE